MTHPILLPKRRIEALPLPLQTACLLPLLLLTSIFVNAQFEPRPIPFDEAVDNGWVTYRATHPETTRGLEVALESQVDWPLPLTFDAGTRFSCDCGRQDQILRRTRQIDLLAGESRAVGFNSWCGNAIRPGALPGDEFALTSPVDESCQEIMRTLDEHRLAEMKIVQQIVWTFTDNHGMAFLHPGYTDDKTYEFVMQVYRQAHATVKVDPGYRVLYEEADGGWRFSGIPLELMGKIAVDLTSLEEPVALRITDAAGVPLRTGAVHFPPFNGVQDLDFALDVRGFERGDFVVELVSLNETSEQFAALPVQL